MAWAQVAGTSLSTIGTLRRGREEEKRYRFDARTLLQEATLDEADIKNKFSQGKNAQFLAAREFGYQEGSAISRQSTTGVSGGSSTSAIRRARSRYSEASIQFGKQISFKRDQGLDRVRMLRDQAKELRRRGKYARKQSYMEAGATLFGGGSQAMAGGR